MDGSLDSTFGTDGRTVTAMDSREDQIFAGAIQADDKIVVVGFAGATTVRQWAVARYNSDGTLDSTFNGTGKFTTNIETYPGHAYAVAIQPDGKIVVGGNYVKDNIAAFAALRLNSDGTPDSGFGSSGIVTTPAGDTGGVPLDMAVQPDGKIILAGYFYVGGYIDSDFALKRLNSDGTLDTTFGTGGETVTPIGSGHDQVSSIALQPTGKIVASGFYMDPNTGKSHIALAQYTSDGALDTTFGDGGKDTTIIDPNNDNPYSVALQPDGKIVVAGKSGPNGGIDYFLQRYIGDRPPVALTDSAALPEDTDLSIAILDNDSDPDNDSITMSSVAPGTKGTVAIDPGDTSLTYTPDPDFFGVDSFTYVITDGILMDTATVYLTVTAVNDAPQAFILLHPVADSVILIYLTDFIPDDPAITFTWSSAKDPDGDLLEYFITFDGALAGLGSHTVSDTTLQIFYPLILDSLYVSEDSILSGHWWVAVDDSLVSTEADNNGRTVSLQFNIDLATDPRPGVPAQLALHPAYPNPFNPSTTILFDLPVASEVHLAVYDLLGREVVRLMDGQLEVGYHQQRWNGRDRDGREVPTGIYFVLVVTPEFRKSIKMVLLK